MGKPINTVAEETPASYPHPPDYERANKEYQIFEENQQIEREVGRLIGRTAVLLEEKGTIQETEERLKKENKQ